MPRKFTKAVLAAMISEYQRDSIACWPWPRRLNPEGYGVVWVDGQHWLAHRYFFTRLSGPIPDGLVIDHLCRNRACVNPTHMEPVTDSENTLRGYGIGMRHAAKTHCANGHPLADGNTYQSQRAKGRRMCVTCSREKGRRNSPKYQKRHTERKRERRAERRALGLPSD